MLEGVCTGGEAQKRLERLQQAKAELEQEAQAELKAAMDNHSPGKPGPRKKAEQTGQPPKDRRQREKEKTRRIRARKHAAAPGRQYNFVDPDSRVMKDSGERGFVQAYNAQIAVDSHAQIIVAAELSQQPIDRQQLLPMVKSLLGTAQGTPTTITADAGYWDTTSLLDPAMNGMEMLIAPDSKPLTPGGVLENIKLQVSISFSCLDDDAVSLRHTAKVAPCSREVQGRNELAG